MHLQALREDGIVITWGYFGDGGDSSEVSNKLTNIKAIYSTVTAFAALREDGTVITWVLLDMEEIVVKLLISCIM